MQTSVYLISIATLLIIALHMFNRRENAGFLHAVVSVVQDSESDEAVLKELNESDEFIAAEQQILPITRASTTKTAASACAAPEIIFFKNSRCPGASIIT